MTSAQGWPSWRFSQQRDRERTSSGARDSGKIRCYHNDSTIPPAGRENSTKRTCLSWDPNSRSQRKSGNSTRQDRCMLGMLDGMTCTDVCPDHKTESPHKAGTQIGRAHV